MNDNELYEQGKRTANQGLAQSNNPKEYAKLLISRMTLQDGYSRGLSDASKEFLKNAVDKS